MVKNLPAVQETRIQFLGWEDPLEKGITTHSSILAWRILWTEEPGRREECSKESDMTDRLTHFKIMMYVKLWNKLIDFKRKGNGLTALKLGNKGKETCAINRFRSSHPPSPNSVGKECVCSAGDPSSIPGFGRSAGEGIGYPLQYSWASFVYQLVKNLPAMLEAWVQSLG